MTEAGIHPKVKQLISLAALIPKAGESTATLETMKRLPPPNNDVKQTADGFFYLGPIKYHADFAIDHLPPGHGRFWRVACSTFWRGGWPIPTARRKTVASRPP